MLQFDVTVRGRSPVPYKVVCRGPYGQPNHPNNGAACQELEKVIKKVQSGEYPSFTVALKATIDPHRFTNPPPCSIPPVHVTLRDIKSDGIPIIKGEIQQNGRIDFSSGCAMPIITSRAGIPNLFPFKR